MSYLETGLSGREHREFVGNVLEVVSNAPDLIKNDKGFRRLGQAAALDSYQALLLANGVLPEDTATIVEKKDKKLQTDPRQKTEVFVSFMRKLNPAIPEGES